VCNCTDLSLSRNPRGFATVVPLRQLTCLLVPAGDCKLRPHRYLKTQATSDSAEMVFVGRVLRIARIHQFGRPDRVSRVGPEVRDVIRHLPGLSEADIESVRKEALNHLCENRSDPMFSQTLIE
jgi:hypothetical protein